MLVAMAPKPPVQLWDAIKVVHYTYPALVVFYFVLAIALTVCTLQTKKLRVQDQRVRRNVILALTFGVGMSYLVEVITVAVRAVLDSSWYPGEDRVVYLIASSIVFGAQGLALTDSKFPVWYPYYGSWFIGIFFELALLILPNFFSSPESFFDYITVAIQILRIVNFLTLLLLFFKLRNDAKEYDNCDAERQSLLRKRFGPKVGSSEDSTLAGHGYGGVTDSTAQKADETDNESDTGSEDSWLADQRKTKKMIEKRLQQDGSWFTYAKGFTIFFPYLWPFHDKRLQFRAVLVGVCLLASNAFHVLVPNQMGIMIDSLTKYTQGDREKSIWLPVAVYAVLLFISGGSCIGWLRAWLWMPLEQYSYDALSTAAHSHLMNLSSDFHDNKTSSDLSQAIQGGRSVSTLLETICFRVLPMFIDLAIAFAYLWALFGPYMGLMMISTVVSYLYITTKLYAQKASKRREYITIFRKEWTVGQQSLDGWNTASLFNMIPYESNRYSTAVKDHMKSKQIYEMSTQAINAVQALVLTLGLLGALSLGAYEVAYGGKSVGQFSTLLVYWAQLQAPLLFFSNMYRQISYCLMDAERLLELFQTKPTITDGPTAKPLKLSQGLVKFDRVSFSYDQRKPTLKNVSFIVPPGKTVALVGETGGGKSTILKLIDRFYDVKGGSISIDGQDIRDVTIDSLRSKIGVVPQEPMLFNDTIINNVRYAKISATDQEVYEACKAAAVHDKIMAFPDGYNSKVGDRGVKLSGGEKQRVAIARAILKQPEIILLDEATSAVDTETEQLIQEGFKTLCNGRTTFIVAHRLSTIMKADSILVVMNGEIIEEGSHDQLIRSTGKYHDLWSKQIFAKPVQDSDGSGSKSPRKVNPNIVNDLPPSQHKTEMAKTLKRTENGESARPDQGETTNNNDQEQVRGHEREGSKLKPDAPEFIPKQATLNSNSSQKINPKEVIKLQKQKEKEERKEASLAKKAGKKAAKRLDSTNDANLSAGMTSQPIENSAAKLPKEDSISPKQTPEKAASHCARFSKRNRTKSEFNKGNTDSKKTSRPLDFSVVDGASEPRPLLQSSTTQSHVSTPSDTPSATSEPKGRIRRPRRSRHWRLKNRTAEASASETAQGTQLPSMPPIPSPRA